MRTGRRLLLPVVLAVVVAAPARRADRRPVRSGRGRRPDRAARRVDLQRAFARPSTGPGTRSGSGTRATVRGRPDGGLRALRRDVAAQAGRHAAGELARRGDPGHAGRDRDGRVAGRQRRRHADALLVRAPARRDVGRAAGDRQRRHDQQRAVRARRQRHRGRRVGRRLAGRDVRDPSARRAAPGERPSRSSRRRATTTWRSARPATPCCSTGAAYPGYAFSKYRPAGGTWGGAVEVIVHNYPDTMQGLMVEFDGLGQDGRAGRVPRVRGHGARQRRHRRRLGAEGPGARRRRSRHDSAASSGWRGIRRERSPSGRGARPRATTTTTSSSRG